MSEFFLVVLPGLEDLCLEEFKRWYPDVEAKLVHGGLTVNMSMSQGLGMNLVLKCPTRILLRVAEFRCRDFPKLYNKFLSLNWKSFINPECQFEIQASTRLSRLKIKSRIEETCTKAWTKYQDSLRVKSNNSLSVQVYVRIVEDNIVISIDTSGGLLHKRGVRTHIGEAPLRETIAASMLELLGRHHKLDRHVELIDPMMGSGTFLIEAIIRDQVLADRTSAFKVFNNQEVELLSQASSGTIFDSLIGFEKDSKTFIAGEENIKRASGSSAGGIQRLAFKNEDFFSANSMAKVDQQRWVICNPPYGARIKVDGPLMNFYQRLFEQAERVARPDLACFILPKEGVKGRFVMPIGWKVLEKRPFLNGGIPVIAFVFGRH